MPEKYASIVEYRRYTLHSGQRDALIGLFERHFIESQNEAGMEVLAHYRDLDDPDAFVWFRGFRDMASRAEALRAFYLDGEAWRTHREAANATMIDSDDVLLLREVRAGSGFGPATRPRPPVGAQLSPSRQVVTAYPLAAPADAAFLDFFDRALAPAAAAAGARLHAAYATEYGANDFPRLPVREGEHVFVWAAGFDDDAARERYRQALASSPRWCEQVLPELSQWLIGSPEVRRLAPAARSLARD